MPAQRGCSEDVSGGLPLPHSRNSKSYAAQREHANRRIYMWSTGPLSEPHKVHSAREVVEEGRQHCTILNGNLGHQREKRFEIKEINAIALRLHMSKFLN